MNTENLKGVLFWIPTLILSVLILLFLIWLEFRPEPTLHALAEAGDLESLQQLIEKTPDVDALNDEGWTPLVCAEKAGQLEVVRLLLVNGADVNALSQDGSTALHHAMLLDSVELIQTLLDAGADPCVKDQNEESAVCLAIERNGRGITLLLERGMELDKKGEKKGEGYLFYAARSECMPVLEKLLADGADVNSRSSVGVTPLLYAAREGHLDAARLLIEHGADVNATAGYDWTALHNAVRAQRVGLIGLLSANDADLEARDRDGHTPLLQAAQGGCVNEFRELLEAGADMDAKDNNKCDAKFLARRDGHTEILELISAHRKKMNGRATDPASTF